MRRFMNKTGKSNMNLSRIRSLCIEIYITLNRLNPEFMKDLFRLHATKRVQREKHEFNLKTLNYNQVT